ncbi:MAG: hypothetical protein SOZ88_01985 [Lachnospiraceae bacterium]|nr:hypothetical protein [Lachnospiraceae bacterium]
MAIQQSTSIPEVRDTIVMLRHLSADEQVRQEAFYREKRLHDEASALGSARREGELIGEARGKAAGRAEGEAIGEARGMISTLARLVKDGLLSVEEAARRANMTTEEFKSKAGL